ncbi:MAG: hypothetical protein KDB53_09285 [Planctomycetes bacterium]|nr:hypothetical protein [Planctomycetota bacterium]
MTPDEKDSDLSQSLGMFEAAVKPQALKLAATKTECTLTVFDGSNQDATTKALGEAVAERLGSCLVTKTFEGTASRDARETVDLILIEAQNTKAGLIVLDAPFGEDIGSLEMESLGSVIDLLIEEPGPPLLIARHPIADAAAGLADSVLIVSWRERLQGAAASWAAAIAKGGGRVEMIAVPDPYLLSEIRAILGDDEGAKLTEDLMHRAETRLAGGLVSAMQQASDIDGFSVSFRVAQGAAVQRTTVDLIGDSGRLAIVAYAKGVDPVSRGRARDIILASRGPVLAIGV